MLGTAGLEMWGNGFYKPRNSEGGRLVVGEASPIAQSCFALEVQGWARL